MDFSAINQLSQKELDQFKSVCNQLLSHTYITRTKYNSEKDKAINSDYTFLSIHFDVIRNYLLLLDWDLFRDDTNGFFYVNNTGNTNHLNLTKNHTAILLALRMIYEENIQEIGIDNEVFTSVQDLLEKIIVEYSILPTKPNMEDVKRGLNIMEHHSIIQKIDGRFTKPSCTFAILPTILNAVSANRLETIVATFKKEEPNEETEENIVD